MSISAWIMFAFGCLVLYGGLSICIWIAVKHHKKTL
ncbi:MetS family NSS transporter small subunit [bacterium]